MNCFYHFKKVFKSLKKMMIKMLQIGLENLKLFEFKSEESFHDCFKYVNYLV